MTDPRTDKLPYFCPILHSKRAEYPRKMPLIRLTSDGLLTILMRASHCSPPQVLIVQGFMFAKQAFVHRNGFSGQP